MKNTLIRIYALFMCTVMLFCSLSTGVYASAISDTETQQAQNSGENITLENLEDTVITLESIVIYFSQNEPNNTIGKIITKIVPEETLAKLSDTAELLQGIIAYLKNGNSSQLQETILKSDIGKLKDAADFLVKISTYLNENKPLDIVGDILKEIIPEDTAEEIKKTAETLKSISTYFDENDLSDLIEDIAEEVMPKDVFSVVKELVKVLGKIVNDFSAFIKEDSSLNENGVVGYLYDSHENCFYTASDPWQRAVGYNEIFDITGPMALISFDTVRFKFDYAGKNWLIQVWKGQYGAIFYGAEIGVYNKPADRFLEHYDAADDDELLKMSMDFYEYEHRLFKESGWEKKFSRPYGEYWWCTGFIPGNRIGRFNKLRVAARITMTDYDMLSAFTKAIENNGISYETNGLDVIFTYG